MAVTSAPLSNLKVTSFVPRQSVVDHDVFCVALTESRNALSTSSSVVADATVLEKHTALRLIHLLHIAPLAGHLSPPKCLWPPHLVLLGLTSEVPLNATRVAPAAVNLV